MELERLAEICYGTIRAGVTGMEPWDECGHKDLYLAMAAAILDSDVIRKVKADVLREFADSIRTEEVLFRRNDGSGVKVTDLLRETAARIECEG